jgi:hypothetical protein
LLHSAVLQRNGTEAINTISSQYWNQWHLEHSTVCSNKPYSSNNNTEFHYTVISIYDHLPSQTTTSTQHPL